MQSQGTFQLFRRFIAVDGTFLKGRFVQVLLLAVGIDANGHNTVLAWGVVESENRSSWEWFFLHLRRAIPQISTEACTVISDRDKGLLEAERILGPTVKTAWCCLHILANYKKAGFAAVSTMFWAIARARTPQDFEYMMAKLEEAKPEAATWLRATDVAKWAEAYFVGRRYGHDTSNIVESVNKALVEERELPILQLLDTIWHRVMDERATRLTIATKAIIDGFTYTPFCAGLVMESRQWARTNQVSTLFSSSSTILHSLLTLTYIGSSIIANTSTGNWCFWPYLPRGFRSRNLFLP